MPEIEVTLIPYKIWPEYDGLNHSGTSEDEIKHHPQCAGHLNCSCDGENLLTIKPSNHLFSEEYLDDQLRTTHETPIPSS